ncbi:MAG: GNAT family N-acetyltransferase [Deltaproteobacteria bacterium]|nr:GNAT family N-acetyltransferase [Deltaproteobacteria bacterium]
MSMISIRKFKDGDANQCAQLFYETIHTVNAKDYTLEQLNAWAPEITQERVERFRCFLNKNISFVAETDSLIVGFSDLQDNGYLNCLFVHKEFQGQRIASKLYGTIEKEALKIGIKILTTEASITARPFFDRQGYSLVKEQEKLHNGVLLKNFIMKKELV